MAERYVKIFYDWPTTTKKLTYEEKGRLIDAIVCYASNQPFELVGNEDFVFPVFQAQIDRDKEKYNDVVEKRRIAGAKGGEQKKANASKCHDDLANASKCEQYKEEDKYIKTKTEDRRQKIEEQRTEEQRVVVVDTTTATTADDITNDTSPIFAYAANNLVYMSPRNFEELESFADDLPDDVIMHAIDEACGNGKRTWNYVRAILNRYIENNLHTLGEVLAAEATRRQNGGNGNGVNPSNYDDAPKRLFDGEIIL